MQECIVNFYSVFSESEPRFTDQNVSVDIVEAQNCTTGDRIEPVTKQETSTCLDMNAADTNGLDILHVNVSDTLAPIITFDSKVLPLTLGITIGTSMRGLILMLIGLLLICVIRMKAKFNQHRKAVNEVEVTTPFNDIQM